MASCFRRKGRFREWRGRQVGRETEPGPWGSLATATESHLKQPLVPSAGKGQADHGGQGMPWSRAQDGAAKTP